MFSTILKMDAIIIGGGTQYFEIESRKPVSILLKYLACKLMKLRGKKFINAGVGIGAINSKIGKYCLRKIFIKANYSFVRDEASKSTLVKLGVPEEKVIVGKDLSYYTDKSKTQSKESGKIKIGINVFDYYNYIENN